MTAKILADSINAITGSRITTFEIKIWKLLLAEFNTHRMLSRSAASSRAIPSKKIREMVLTHPAMPLEWGLNRKGMQATEMLSAEDQLRAEAIWLEARDEAVRRHIQMEEMGIHKQVCNRVLEPWMTATVVCSGTEWQNFFSLRDHPDAQPEFRAVAAEMNRLYKENEPNPLSPGQWHLPYITEEEDGLPELQQVRISAARCARTSYATFDGKKSAYQDDLELCMKLMASQPLHASPMEHQALAISSPEPSGNFRNGFRQHREFVERGIKPYSDWEANE